MKRKSLSNLVVLPAVLLALSAHAHDPKEHMKDAEKPDCAAMKDMDHHKMDMNDPVMQAMMQQCMKEMHHDEAGSDNAHVTHGTRDEENETKKPPKHEHKK